MLHTAVNTTNGAAYTHRIVLYRNEQGKHNEKDVDEEKEDDENWTKYKSTRKTGQGIRGRGKNWTRYKRTRKNWTRYNRTTKTGQGIRGRGRRRRRFIDNSFIQ